MNINSIKDLNKIMLLCRKNGVRSMKIDGVEFIMEDVSYQDPKAIKHQVTGVQALPETYAPGGINADSKIQTPDELTPEQLLFYSATGQEDLIKN